MFVFFLPAVASAALDYRDNEPDEIRVMNKAKQMAKRGAWEKVEQWLVECEEKRARVQSGQLKMIYVHYGIAASSSLLGGSADEEWLKWLEGLEKWEEKTARKDIALALKIEFWCDFAWKARSDKWAHEVRAEQWDSFARRLKKAQQIYDGVELKGAQYPWFYRASMMLALGQCWTNERAFEEVLVPGLKVEPENVKLIADYDWRLQPRWYGRDGDDYKFCKQVMELVPASIAKEMYARSLVFRKLHEGHHYQAELVEWEDFQHGVRDILKKYPKCNKVMRAYLTLAERQGEFEDAISYLKKVAPQSFEHFCESSVYGSIYKMPVVDEKGLEYEGFFKPKMNSDSDVIKDILWLPCGTRYLASAGRRGVYLFHVDQKSSLSHFAPSERWLQSLALSEDGKTVAASSSYDPYLGFKDSKVYVLEVVGDELLLRKEVTLSPRWDLSLSFGGNEQFLYQSYFSINEGVKGRIQGLDRIHWKKVEVETDVILDYHTSKNYVFDIVKDPENRYTYVSHDGLKRYDDRKVDEAPKELFSPAQKKLGVVYDLEFLNGGKYLAVIQENHKTKKFSLTVVDVKSGEQLATTLLNEIKGRIYSLSTEPDCEEGFFYMVGYQGALARWRFDESDHKLVLVSVNHGNGQKMRSVKVSPTLEGERRVLVGTERGMIGKWRIPARNGVPK
jgi:WD40 repeat protein